MLYDLLGKKITITSYYSNIIDYNEKLMELLEKDYFVEDIETIKQNCKEISIQQFLTNNDGAITNNREIVKDFFNNVIKLHKLYKLLIEDNDNTLCIFNTVRMSTVMRNAITVCKQINP